MPLLFVLAESALERVPKELWKHPSVVRTARARRKRPGAILLDRSLHHPAMRNLPNASKRGRPDLVHTTLLAVMGSPLNKEGLLRTYVHTLDGHVIEIDPSTRLPKNYNRFVGLIEQLYEEGQVPPGGPPLLVLRKESISHLVERLKPDRVVIFTTEGEPKTVEEVIRPLSGLEKPMVIVGGFPHGTFTDETLSLADETARIDPEGLDAWVVASRVVYEFEKALGLPEKRLAKIRPPGHGPPRAS